jgi:putative transposase
VPRKPRDLVEGGVYHVYARGNARHRIFRDDRDRRLYLSILDHVVGVKRWRCIAYCLMGNHVHLLLETPEPNLDTGMQLLHGLYGQRHNVRHERSGHLFQGRYGASRLASTAQLERALAYIQQNPVEAGLCERPDDWPWLNVGASDPRGSF